MDNSFEDLYGAWTQADEAARYAEAEMMTALAASPEVPGHLVDRARALRDSANHLLDRAMDRMRDEAKRPRPRWQLSFAI